MGLGEKEEKPFWTKFLKSDYGSVNDLDKPLLPQVLDVLEGTKNVDEVVAEDENSRALDFYRQTEKAPETPVKKTAKELQEEAKLKAEWAKIRRLENQLGQASKAQ